MLVEELHRMTLEEFLEWERKQEMRHEYVDGIVRQRVSSAYTHSVIAAQIMGELMIQLGDSKGMVLGNRMGLLSGQNYVYSDLLVLCDEPKLYDHHDDALINPRMTVEIVSTETKEYDRTIKRQVYEQFASVQAYLMIGEAQPIAELYTRQEGLLRRQSRFVGIESVVPLECIGCELKFEKVYRRTKFEDVTDAVEG